MRLNKFSYRIFWITQPKPVYRSDIKPVEISTGNFGIRIYITDTPLSLSASPVTVDCV
jgi:hypothetical protein